MDDFFSFPDGFFSGSSDPIRENPFEVGTELSHAWAKVTDEAQRRSLVLKAAYLASSATDIQQGIDYLCAEFDVWAWRGAAVAVSPEEIDRFDKWLPVYAQTMLVMALELPQVRRLPRTVADSYALRLRTSLGARTYHWRAEVRRAQSQGSGSSAEADNPARRVTERPTFPKRAEWLEAKMLTGIISDGHTEAPLSVNRLRVLSGLDAATIKRVLDGAFVNRVTLQKLAAAFSVRIGEIPSD